MSAQPMPTLAPPLSLTELPGAVWGIDPSTLRVAVAIVEPFPWEVEVTTRTCSLARSSGARRLADALAELEPWFADLGGITRPTLCWVEQPFAQAKHVHPSSYFMVGIVLAALWRAFPGLVIETVSPPQWKKLAMGAGAGGASKDRIMDWAHGVGYAGSLQDEADAIGVATAAAVTLDGMRRAA